VNRRAALAAAVALVVILTVTSAVGLTVGGTTVSVPGVALAAPGAAPSPTADAPPQPSLTDSGPVDPGDAVPTPTPSPAPEPADAPTAAQLRGAMLRPADIGSGWRAAPVPSPDAEVRSVCGGTGVVSAFPDAVRAGAAMSSGKQAVQESVSAFADAATATKASAVYLKGLACSRGTVGGAVVAVSPDKDATTAVAADDATTWTLTAKDASIVIVSARSGTKLVNLAVLTPNGKKGADALALAAKAVARLRTL
jgi:hypothetical protein